MHQSGFEVSDLIAVQLSRDPEAAEEVSHQSVCHRRNLLIEDGVDFRPLGEVVHGDQGIDFSCRYPEKALQYRWRSSRSAHPRCTDASGSDFWFWDIG
jgi:hypothetical protein